MSKEIIYKLSFVYWGLYAIGQVITDALANVSTEHTIIELTAIMVGVLITVCIEQRRAKNDKIKWDEHVNQSITAIADQASMKVGQAYFDTVAQGVMNLVDCDYVMIGQLDYTHGASQPYIKTHAIHSADEKLEDIEYIINTVDLLRASGIEATTDPNAMSPPPELISKTIKTHIAIPLISTEGQILGVISCMWQKFIINENTVRPILNIFAGRCQSELERIITEDKLNFKANYDALTLLPNRGYMMNDINKIVREFKTDESMPGDRYHVYFIDLDDFKEINDEFGHEAGDALLKEIANRLSSCVRSDDIVARLGGDEFIIIEHYHNPSPERVADRIIEKLGNVVVINKMEVSVTASVGYVEVPGDTSEPAEILKYADFAMYRAKELGKNKHVRFTKDLFAENRAEKSMEYRLTEAIEKKELSIAIQPLISSSTEKVVKGEVLARWEDQGEFISPEVFITLAEKRGLINALGKLIFEKGVAFCAKLKTEEEIYARFCINCSTLQLKDPKFIKFAYDLVNKYGISPRQITLEITETMLSDEDSIMTSLLNAKELGFEIAIDDFGTGYSSIALLEHLPVDIIKLDKVLVAGSHKDAKMATVLDSVAKICKAYKYKLVAEGVETKEDLDIVTKAGYDMIQGYYYSKPLTMQDYTAYVKENT